LSAASRQKLFPFTPGGGSNRTVWRFVRQFHIWRTTIVACPAQTRCCCSKWLSAARRQCSQRGAPRIQAGGEQPKFTAFNAKLTSHVIVKFSPMGNNEVITVFWSTD
jgi:hypothetical protein